MKKSQAVRRVLEQGLRLTSEGLGLRLRVKIVSLEVPRHSVTL